MNPADGTVWAIRFVLRLHLSHLGAATRAVALFWSLLVNGWRSA